MPAVHRINKPSALNYRYLGAAARQTLTVAANQDISGHGLEVGQHAAEPTLGDIRHVHAGGLSGNIIVGKVSTRAQCIRVLGATSTRCMPTTEWLNKYEAIKNKLTCKDDLEAHFTEKVIGNMAVDVLDIGTVHFPTGTIFACDPMVELEDTQPFIQTIPAGTYPVKLCVVPSEKYGDRYACVKVEISGEKPVRYELGMTGKEDLDEELGEDEYFGFGVDAGMGCVADIQTQAAFKTYWAKRLEEDPDIDPYNDLFCDLLEENAKAHPKYQGDCGEWLNWTVPDTDCKLPIFASGWGDGYYPVYFGYDAKGEVRAVYVLFLDIEDSYKEQA